MPESGAWYAAHPVWTEDRGARFIELHTPDGRPYVLALWSDNIDPYQDGVARYGTFGNSETLLWNLIAPSAVMLDLGANIGGFAIPFARYRGVVHAFELLPDNAWLMRRAAMANNIGTLTITHGAVRDRSGAVPIGGISAWGHIITGESDKSVRAFAIDDFVSAHRVQRIDAMKIDIEGSELSALRGMGHTLSAYQPDIVIESNALCACEKHSIHDVLAELKGYGYRLYHIGDKVLRRFAVNDYQEAICCDYFATATRTESDITELTGFAIKDAMSSAEVATALLGEDAHPTEHRVYSCLAFDGYAPPEIRRDLGNDPTIAAMLAQWRRLVAENEVLATKLREAMRPIG